MKNSDFPMLFTAADEAAIATQLNLKIFFIASITGLLFGCLFSAFDHFSCRIISALLFIISLFFVIGEKLFSFQKKWYLQRALAESVKTATWRFVMNADPYNKGDEKDEKKLTKVIQDLLLDNVEAAASTASHLKDQGLISESMRKIRKFELEEKTNYYFTNRVIDQKDWYKRKAVFNARKSKHLLISIVICYIVAIALAITRTTYNFSNLPIDLIAIFTGGIIGWMQINRFDELASAYTLTTHEIARIAEERGRLTDNEKLGNFVADAENAFSREHTQWAARRDHG